MTMKINGMRQGRLRLSAKCLWLVIYCFSITLAGRTMLGQDATQDLRLGTDAQTNTGPVVQPGTPMVQGATPPAAKKKQDDSYKVEQTGGIINTHPEDLLNQPRYIWPEELRDQSEVVQVPAPQIVDLSGLNQNASSIQYEDRGRGPFSFAVESTAVHTNNLFNEFTRMRSGTYIELAFPTRIYLASLRSNLSFFNRTSTSVYPGNSELSNWSSIFNADLNHRVSSLTDWTMNFAGGRTTGVGTYLPAVIPVGTTSVVQAGTINGLDPTYNLAGSFALTHRLTELNRVITSFTGAWLDRTGKPTIPPSGNDTRQQTAGADFHFQHATSARSAVGAELTDIFVRGISPIGHSNFTSIKGTYQYSFTEHGVLELGAGPLFDRSSSHRYGNTSNMTYAANAGVNYRTAFGKMSGGYARVVQIGFLVPAGAGNQLYATFDRPINRYIDFTAAGSYTLTASKVKSESDFTDVGISSRLNFNFTRSLVFFSGYTYFDQRNQGGSLSHQDMSAGLTYTFGSSLARRGDRQ